MPRRTKLTIGVLAAMLSLVMLVYAVFRKPKSAALVESVRNAKDYVDAFNFNVPEKSITIDDLKLGNGTSIQKGDRVQMHYRIFRNDGLKLENSYASKNPLEVVVGGGQVMKGWDQGLSGMKVGGRRRIVVSPSLAYGEKGAGAHIPPHTTLVIEVELLRKF